MPETIVETWAEAEAEINGLARRAAQPNLMPWLRETMVDLEELHEGYFGSESDPLGAAWPELAPATIARKGHNRILYDTGRLAASLTSKSGDAIREIISEPAGQGLAFGTSVDYAPFHQFGTSRIPQRQHVGVNDRVIDIMAERVADFAMAYALEGEPNERV